MAVVIDGREIAAGIYERIGEVVRGSKVGIISSSAASARVYASVVKKNAANLGVEIVEKVVDEHATTSDIISEILELSGCDGIVIQGPFRNVEMEKVYASLPLEKDIEGMCAGHLGQLYRKPARKTPLPCTPAAVIKIIESTGIELKGRDVCIINHSPVIGKPLTTLLLNADATVSVCHAYTKHLEYYTSNADIVVCAVGIPEFLKGTQVKQGSFVIDCGMNRKDGKIVGDADFASLKEKCSYITPVPGGVGPVTTSMLFYNLAKLKQNLEA